MAEYLEIFAEAGLDVPVICGGAALTRAHLETTMRPLYPAGVHYAADAMEGLRLLGGLVAQPRRRGGNGRPRGSAATGTRGRAVGPRPALEVDRQATVVEAVPTDQILAMLDRRALFERRWRLGALSQKQRNEAEARLAGLWRRLEPVARPRAIYAVALDGRWRQAFRSDVLARQPALGLQVVTLGTNLDPFGPLGAEEAFLLHGLAAEWTEALARWCERQVARSAGWGETRRISPGFPVWPDLAEQRKVFDLLRPERIGVHLNDGLQMVPEYSTSAAVVERRSAGTC
jgi:5-methyltetrahydrofolate--homocysteine methyltransferase